MEDFVKELQLQKVFCIYSGPEKKYISTTDGAQATAENLSTAKEAMVVLHRLVGGSYPPEYSLALSLDASGCICVDLFNAWDESRAAPVEGGALWLQTMSSYSELCHPNEGQRAIRIIGRGKVPEGAVIPPAVKITTSGFITLTTQRIPCLPAWQGSDDGGVIKDITSAIDYLAVAKRPRYVNM
jgi:hypothetical protein